MLTCAHSVTLKGTYGVLPYFISKTLVELVMSFLTMALAVLVGYWLMALQSSMILHILNPWGLSLTASSVALFLGCLVKDVTLARRRSTRAAPRGPLHEGRSTWGSQIFFILTCAPY